MSPEEETRRGEGPSCSRASNACYIGGCLSPECAKAHSTYGRLWQRTRGRKRRSKFEVEGEGEWVLTGLIKVWKKKKT